MTVSNVSAPGNSPQLNDGRCAEGARVFSATDGSGTKGISAVLPRPSPVTVTRAGSRCCIPYAEAHILGAVVVCCRIYRRVAVAGPMAFIAAVA